MELLLSKFLKGGAAVNQAISWPLARLFAEPTEKALGGVLRTLGELPGAKRSLCSWPLMAMSSDCSRPKCHREGRKEGSSGCRIYHVPSACSWADPTAALCPLHLIHPHSEGYAESIFYVPLISPPSAQPQNLKKRKRRFVNGAENTSSRVETLNSRGQNCSYNIGYGVASAWHSTWHVVGPQTWFVNGWRRQNGRCGWTEFGLWSK